MKYAYEDLSDAQFEELIILLCQRLLGIAVQKFSQGPDGGRDAKFIGTAELYPSKASPWAGTTIIQAKHTNGYNRHFSESDFFSKKSTSTILGDEIVRIRKLRDNKHIDHYMLFANRRLGANTENTIRAHISEQCQLPESSICLCGLEQMDLWLKNFSEVPKLAKLDPVDSPLIVSPDDLAEVVQALAHLKEDMEAAMDHPPTARTAYDEKNRLNNLTTEYAVALRRKYLKETNQVRSFLAAPENIALLRMYEAVADEFQLKIISKRKDYHTFDEVLEYLLDLLFNRDPVLRQHRRLTRVMLFYMYWNCDIGETPNATTDQALAPRPHDDQRVSIVVNAT